MPEHKIDLDRAIARGLQAAALLDSEMFRGVYQEEIETTINAIRYSRPTDVDGREMAVKYLNVLDRLMQRLMGLRDSGKLAAEQKTKPPTI